MRYLILICFLLSGCATLDSTQNEVKFANSIFYNKTCDCALRNTEQWNMLPDKIDKWQYRIYGPHIQNCYEKEE
jgi:hypothetical protein